MATSKSDTYYNFITKGYTIIKYSELAEFDLASYYKMCISSYTNRRIADSINYDNERSTYLKDLDSKGPLVKDLFTLLYDKGLSFLKELDVVLETNTHSLIKDNDAGLLAINHYSSVHKDKPLLIPHTDSGLITILPKATNSGLQMLENNQWIDVTPKEDEIVIIAGEMLQRMTNKRIKAPIHQVAFPKNGEDRYSTYYVFFPDNIYDISIDFNRDK